MATVDESVYFRKHTPYQADRLDRVRHALVVPSLVLGILGFARMLRAFSFDLAAAAAVAVLILSAALDPRGALISLVVLVVLFLSTRLSWQVTLEAFIFGWGFQFVGHILEGTKPKEFSIRVCR